MVREKSVHLEVIQMVISFAASIGFQILNLEFSPIKGPEGNIEYLLYLQKGQNGENSAVEMCIRDRCCTLLWCRGRKLQKVLPQEFTP